MGKSFLPASDSGLLAWTVHFRTMIQANSVLYGLSAPIAAAYGLVSVAYEEAYQTAFESTRTRGIAIAVASGGLEGSPTTLWLTPTVTGGDVIKGYYVEWEGGAGWVSDGDTSTLTGTVADAGYGKIPTQVHDDAIFGVIPGDDETVVYPTNSTDDPRQAEGSFSNLPVRVRAYIASDDPALDGGWALAYNNHAADTVEIDDVAPTFNIVADDVAYVGENFNYQITCTDPGGSPDQVKTFQIPWSIFEPTPEPESPLFGGTLITVHTFKQYDGDSNADLVVTAKTNDDRVIAPKPETIIPVRFPWKLTLGCQPMGVDLWRFYVDQPQRHVPRSPPVQGSPNLGFRWPGCSDQSIRARVDDRGRYPDQRRSGRIRRMVLASGSYGSPGHQ